MPTRRFARALIGAQALGERLGRGNRALMAGVAARLRSGAVPEGPVAVDSELIGDHADLVHLLRPLRDLPELAGLERWLARHVVQRVPGAGDARD